MRTEIISKKTRTEFCEHLVGWTLRTIANEFDSADIPRDLDHDPQVSGERRTLVLQYYHGLDFTNPADVKKLLVAYEGILNSDVDRAEAPLTSALERDNLRAAVERLCKLLRRDGYVFEQGRLLPINGAVSLDRLRATAVEFDADHLAQQIKRIEDSVEGDPAHAIGSAKELIETCCRTILAERGNVDTEKLDVQPLVRRTMEELSLVPDGIPEQAKGARSIKALLGNLATVAQSMAELRNLYGTGHGKEGRTKGLTARHARLAVGAAVALTVFLFETHQELEAATARP